MEIGIDVTAGPHAPVLIVLQTARENSPHFEHPIVSNPKRPAGIAGRSRCPWFHEAEKGEIVDHGGLVSLLDAIPIPCMHRNGIDQNPTNRAFGTKSRIQIAESLERQVPISDPKKVAASPIENAMRGHEREAA